ncbi:MULTISPECIES: hypothetical protein [unclassified Mesorhizobium]|uniref:deazapurine DNA modification protein DpdA family protein n=1 Tax=unclassified Mesorhizobium TaxID=325217 RepID=UPI000FCAE3BF|nr:MULTISPECIES: hypothetical protein [unclassified Mesorhizobium]RUV98351.1 hypothetical protein EOA49_23965 [Mesorhizobium sp. M1A.F.Ca.IN.020.04.1.1]RUW16315.1 hypothetical protein EOA53_00760 [Mesorhizobium sp. M1A.F.Ca.IN.020.03.1.1]RWF75307.1 MAG: hypothetical protein EOQ34_02350 [Mesorhizobium sp.]RWG15815.1 MAG: hypothetical protein EOQ58_10410 [Mesorhizobium sp.]RWG31391.1 MAG: hypothetical protein EOQ61_13345 [Mesorhizobium sp.]
MKVFLGIPACFTSFARVVAGLPGGGGLVSANAFFNHKTGRFRIPASDLFCGIPVALDSAGFVAMVRYWFYRWTLDQYVALAGAFPWEWWAAPDFCCEREVAHDRAEVRARVVATAAKLAWAQLVAADTGVKPPMPVLQGWQPDDYLRCADLIDRFSPLPDLVGIGSVCRRHLGGPDGVVSVVDRLDSVLPHHVRFHLFGVKGAVAIALRGHHRIASIDSQAWDAAARREATKVRGKVDGFTCDVAYRSTHLRAFHRDLHQGLTAAPPYRPPTQMAMFLEAAE